jgi:VanZ family protein
MRTEPLRLNYQPVWLALGWLMVAVVIWLSLSPSPPKGPDFPDSDKLMHGLTYLVLTGWFGQLYRSRVGRLGWAVGFAALGAVLEVMQGVGGVREASWGDGVANAVGAVCGWLLLRTRLAGALYWAVQRFMLDCVS